MITIYQKTVKDPELRVLKEFKVGSWIYVEDPTEQEILRLVKEFGLEDGLLHDAVDPYEVPRMETEEDVIYIYTRAPYMVSGGHVSTIPLLVAVGSNFVVTVSKKQLPFLEMFKKGGVDFYTTQKTKLVLQIFSQINAAYGKFLTDISRKVRGMSVQVEKIKNKDIVQFVTFEQVLNDFIAALVPTNIILQKLLSGSFLELFEDDEDMIEDLFLDNGQIIESSKANLKNIVHIRDSYSTIVTNNLNSIIKLLTALTIILAVPTMIASFYGMNVALPFAGSPLAFFGIVGVTIVIALVLFGIFVKNDWL